MDERTWLDSWMPRRLPGTFRAVRRYATRSGHAADLLNPEPPPRKQTLADTMYILRHGKKAWRAKIADEQNVSGEVKP
jgi:hypothetical protein